MNSLQASSYKKCFIIFEILQLIFFPHYLKILSEKIKTYKITELFSEKLYQFINLGQKKSLKLETLTFIFLDFIYKVSLSDNLLNFKNLIKNKPNAKNIDIESAANLIPEVEGSLSENSCEKNNLMAS